MMSQLCLKTTSAPLINIVGVVVVVQAIVVPTPCRGKLWPSKSAISSHPPPLTLTDGVKGSRYYDTIAYKLGG